MDTEIRFFSLKLVAEGFKRHKEEWTKSSRSILRIINSFAGKLVDGAVP